MDSNSKVEYLIVDTSAFIKNAALQEIGNKIITEPAVVNEITSKRQLRRLVVLPYDLEVKDAYPEDIKFVTEFAKKTGDYTSLSATDIKVIALTYRYEKEKVGVSHLKQEPKKKTEIVVNPEDHSKPPVGFYIPEKNGNKDNNTDETCKGTEENKNREVEIQVGAHENSLSSTKDEHLVTTNAMTEESEEESDYDSAESDEIYDADVNTLNKKFEQLDCNPEELKIDCEDSLTVDDILKPVKTDDTENIESSNSKNKTDEHSDVEEEKDEEEGTDEDVDSNGGDDDDDDDDDDGWITPRNITTVKKKIDSGLVKEKPATVACLTMDYAMQNILMQIGLNVASLEGKIIKEMRTFILRCYACFQTTSITTKIFCPSCGNKTLKKVAVRLDDEGKQKILINYKKPLTARGKRFSLPKIQGGKHACNPILVEDQPMPDQRPTKLGRTRNDPLNEDYIAGYSPFVMRDVNSRAAMLGIKSGNPVKYWMRRNPNEVRKTRK